MSYDYSLFKPLGPGPMSSWPAQLPESLGSTNEVKQALSGIFPGTIWEPFDSSWFGRWESQGASAEFQLTAESADGIHFLTMRRTERAAVERLCEHLKIMALDQQTMEQYSTLTRCWSRAG
jgi:hypothetical protein